MGREEAMIAAKDGAVSVEEAVRFLGLGRSQLYQHMTAGRLRFLKVGARRLILRSELERFLAEQVLASAG